MKPIPENNFLMLPHELVERHLRELGYAEFCLLIAMFHISFRLSTRKFYQSDNQLEERFGFSKKTLYRARISLAKKGFIKYKSGFKWTTYSRATRYELLPDKRLREEFRIAESESGQKDSISTTTIRVQNDPPINNQLGN
jgi:predicted DNA-binding transcriptional regulator AlpA